MNPIIELEPVYNQILLVKTPCAWVARALDNIEMLLLDHAHCERKASTTALSLINRYPEKDISSNLSALAREELVHFEKVCKLLKKSGFVYRNLKSGPYARTLYDAISPLEPNRFRDSLLVCALIESRSSERFLALHHYLPKDLQKFYSKLHEAEVRHSNLYINLYRNFFGDQLAKDIQPFSEIEASLITQPDPLFRFHSGI